MKRLLIVCLLLGVFLTIQWWSSRSVSAAPASTPVCGTITSDTTWITTNSPYEVCGSGVTVATGVTLTIQAGVTVQFQVNSILIANGTLSAIGTATTPITFTGVIATPGSWQGIEIDGSVAQLNRSVLSYITSEYAGFNVSTGAQIYLSQSNVSISHALIRNGGAHGIYGSTKGSANIADSTFTNNVGYAILFGDGRVNPVLAHLTATGNGTNGVGLGGGSSPLTGAHVWEYTGIPYVLVTTIQVTSGSSLTIEPGVVVQGGSNEPLDIVGQLTAIGFITNPITFTSVTAAPGAWVGIVGASTVLTPAQMTLDHVVVDYAGGGTNGEAIETDHTVLTLTNSLIRNSAGDGVQTHQLVTTTIQNVQFINNANNAVQLIIPTPALQLSNLSATGNGFNGIKIFSTTYWRGQNHLPYTGLPYKIDGVFGNFVGDSLTIDPGNELFFTPAGWLNIAGQLKAIGLPTAPITFTTLTKQPGDWIGLVIYGGTQPANAQLDYATVEYAGSDINGANVDVTNGVLIARHSVIRYSAKDGVRFNSHASGSILNSQIISNSQVVTTTYGVLNITPSRAVLATNNWWGDPNGPTPSVPSCGSGHGDRVSTGVLYRPVLTSTNLNAEFPLSDAPQLTLTPRRWFAPADGLTRVYFDITLRDANGAPIPGRTVKLSTTLGTAVDGGITDASGKTLAYLTSGSAGDADVTAALDATTACEGALSPTARVTFTPPLNITDLLPNAPASYLDGDIEVTPQPIIVGVTTTLRAKFTNPLTVPITVDVSFGFVQSSIGLAFGPIKEIVGQVLPANSSVILSAAWVPSVSGHYCVQVTYNITAIGSRRLLRSEAGGSGSKQKNLNPYPGPQSPPNDKDSLDKADKAFKKVEKLSPRGTNIQKGIIDRWWEWAKDSAKKISQSLGGDPPRQDYTQISVPVSRTWPLTQPSASISSARAAALNATSAALADVNAYGTAAAIALDRYAGASEAHDLTWAAQQANARLYYQQQLGSALLTYANRLENFVQVLVDEGETNITVTVSDVISYQQVLSTTGFTAQEIADAKLVGLTDADIEAYRQETIAANPNDLAGNILDMYRDEVTVCRELGFALLHPHGFSPGATVSGGAGLRPATDGGNTLAQIYNTVSTIQLGNPLTQTATIDLRARRIDLPADWGVNVSPAQVTLAPGEQITVTITVNSGSLVPQGNLPRVAVEGYAGSQLLGGVVVEVVVPQYLPGFFRVLLPAIRR